MTTKLFTDASTSTVAYGATTVANNVLLSSQGSLTSTFSATASSGGSDIDFSTQAIFISPQSQSAWTLSGTITFNLWGLESSMNTNSTFMVHVYHCDLTGTLTEIPGSPFAASTELGTGAGLINFTGTPSSGTSFAVDERLVFRVTITNVGTMGSGTVTLDYGGGSGSGVDFDSWFQITETVTFANATSEEQIHFRARNDDGGESTATWFAAVDTNWSQTKLQNFRVRFVVQENSGLNWSGGTNWLLQYSHNSGTWTNVGTGSDANINYTSSPNLSAFTVCTSQMTGRNEFDVLRKGETIATAAFSGAAVAVTAGCWEEWEFCLQIASGAAVGDTIQLRVQTLGNTTYTTVPTITVTGPLLVSDAAIPFELLSSLAQKSVNIESVASPRIDNKGVFESLSGKTFSNVATAEEMKGIKEDSPLQSESKITISNTHALALENLATTLTLTKDGKFYLEINKSLSTDEKLVDEFLSSFRKDSVESIEVIGNILITSNGVVPLEFKSTVLLSINAVLPIEIISQLIENGAVLAEIRGAGTTLTFPTLSNNPAQIVFGIQGSTQIFQYDISDFFGAYPLEGDRWVCSLMYDTLSRSDWALLSVFAAIMRGETGRVFVTPLHAATPRGVATGTPLVSGDNQTGSTLVTTGWTPNVTGILKTGDFFHFKTAVGQELKILTSDANSDASGNATLRFSPPIRTSPANGTLIVTQNPSCIMKFVDDRQGQIKIQPPLIGSVQFEFIEALA